MNVQRTTPFPSISTYARLEKNLLLQQRAVAPAHVALEVAQQVDGDVLLRLNSLSVGTESTLIGSTTVLAVWNWA